MSRLIIWMIGILIVVAIFSTYSPPASEEDMSGSVVSEYAINPQVDDRALTELIKSECERQNVSESLVYAIINSPYPDDNIPRYGVMKLHEDLVDKYNVNWDEGEGIIENPKANVMAGIGRLKWAAENNASLDGILMVYIYTKPNAQRLWADEAKTTEWVESLREAM